MKLFNRVAARNAYHAMFSILCGYFFHRCPVCDQWFGGHQVSSLARKGLVGIAWTEEGHGVFGLVICKKCFEDRVELKSDFKELKSDLSDAETNLTMLFALKTGCMIRQSCSGQICGLPPRHLSSPDDFRFFFKLMWIGTLTIFICAGFTLFMGFRANVWTNVCLALGWFLCWVGHRALTVSAFRPWLAGTQIFITAFNFGVQVMFVLDKIVNGVR
jgi:hypothetical protein